MNLPCSACDDMIRVRISGMKAALLRHTERVGKCDGFIYRDVILYSAQWWKLLCLSAMLGDYIQLFINFLLSTSIPLQFRGKWCCLHSIYLAAMVSGCFSGEILR